MQDLDRIRYITHYYDALKGLKAVPFGLFMLVMAARGLGWTGLGKEGDCTYTLPLLLFVIALYFAADRYYTRRFGYVRVSNPQVNMLASLGLVALFFGIIALEVVVKPPISLIGLFIGAALVYSGLRTRRVYYSAAGVVMCLVSLVPLLLPAFHSAGPFATFGFFWNFALGVTWVALGLADHFRLVRSFKTIEGEPDARPDQ